MKHYLVELYKHPKIDDPAEKAPAIHKHFTRYSRGKFDGPVVKIKQTASKISLWASYEYEDLALKFALHCLPAEEIQIKGTIISGIDFSPLVSKLGMDAVWNPTKSTGKTKNYTTKLKTFVSVETKKIVEFIEKGEPYLYFLFTIENTEFDVKLRTKTKPPRPSNKNPEKSSAANKLKFCTLKVPNTPENLEWILDGAFADFKDEIPEDWSSLTVENTYEIKDLEFPKKKMSSRMFRLQTVRIGEINRILDLDGTTITKNFEFKA